MTLRFRRLAESSERRCDECGTRWFERVPYGRWDDRPDVAISGTIGQCQIRTTLCPVCAEEFLLTFYHVAGWAEATIADDRQVAYDALRGRWLASLPCDPESGDVTIPYPDGRSLLELLTALD